MAAGFPCISLSPLTSTPAALSDASSSSGLGWKSIDQYVERHRPKVVLLENVQTLFQSCKLDGGKKPWLGWGKDRGAELHPRYDFIRERLESYGYMVNAALFDTAEFGPAQSRHRAWIISGLGCNTVAAIKDVASLRCETWPLSACVKPELELDSIPQEERKRKQR